MKKKILVGVLMGAMAFALVGCKGKDSSENEDTLPKQEQQGGEVTTEATKAPEVLGEEMYEYKDKFYGFSFKMPEYTRGDYMGAAYVRRQMVGAEDLPQIEKYIAVYRYLKASHEDIIDIYQINSVYDIHEHMGEMAYENTLGAIKSWKMDSCDITVAEEAETINGYEMLKYEGTMEISSAMGPQKLGITGYYIFADGLPLVVQAVDSTATVYDVEYEGELSQMDSLRAEVDAMVRTFNGDNMINLNLVR